MAITGLKSMTSAIVAGQCLKQSWNKTFAITTVTGHWYSTFQVPGQPVAGVYGGVTLTNASGNWTAASSGNIVTVDTIVPHGLFISETVATNSSWSTNTWMQSLTGKAIISVPTPHTFTFALTVADHGSTVEAGTSANIAPTALQSTSMIGSSTSAATNYGGAFNPGRICHAEDVASMSKHLVGIEAITATAASCPSYLMLVDMLLNYPGISMTSASAQTFVNTVALPRYTSGIGVMAFLEMTTANGTGAQNVTITYTNNNGTAGQTVPGTVANVVSGVISGIPYTGTAVNNFGPFLPLASNDQGIRSVQSLQFSGASTLGAASLVLCRPLATIPLVTVGVASAKDFMFDIFTIPRIYDGACLSFLYFSGLGVANPALYGILDFVWG